MVAAKLAETLGPTESERAIPIVEFAATHAIGLVTEKDKRRHPWFVPLSRRHGGSATIIGHPMPQLYGVQGIAWGYVAELNMIKY